MARVGGPLGNSHSGPPVYPTLGLTSIQQEPLLRSVGLAFAQVFLVLTPTLMVCIMLPFTVHVCLSKGCFIGVCPHRKSRGCVYPSISYPPATSKPTSTFALVDFEGWHPSCTGARRALPNFRQRVAIYSRPLHGLLRVGEGFEGPFRAIDGIFV